VFGQSQAPALSYHLPRADERDGRLRVDQIVQFTFNSTLDHPCIYGVVFRICKEEMRTLLLFQEYGRTSDASVAAALSILAVVVGCD
jgi:hypothetical protein